MTHATPRPWILDDAHDDLTIIGGETVIAKVDGITFPKVSKEAKANARLIVLSVNTHERAKAALKGLLHHGQGEGKLVALYVPQDMLDQARSTLTDMEG